MYVVAAALAILLAIAFAGSGFAKVTEKQQMLDSADHLGVPRDRYRIIGGLELAAAAGLIIGLAVAFLGIAAAVGLVLLMTGAVTYHLRAHDGPKIFALPAMLGVLALLEVIFRSASA